jgi:hypothetical protein
MEIIVRLMISGLKICEGLHCHSEEGILLHVCQLLDEGLAVPPLPS